MRIKITVILVLSILVSAGLALSEDSAGTQATSAPALPESSDSSTQWVWGEVVNVDSLGKAFTLKYLDYETDQEKELSLTVDDATSYQNFKSLDDIQPKDNLSIDYIAKDGKNIAKSISLEKTESASLENKTETDAASPEAVQPAATPQAGSTGAEKPETSAQTN
ncbi:MAG: hypothetical protein Q7K98_01125 [Candidatus Omnitrophota bacterium]|nr:hypothetical protein [Candidatus Omnitrophota bacterium]